MFLKILAFVLKCNKIETNRLSYSKENWVLEIVLVCMFENLRMAPILFKVCSGSKTTKEQEVPSHLDQDWNLFMHELSLPLFSYFEVCVFIFVHEKYI